MSLRILSLTVFACSAIAWPAGAQVVQLPTFQFFSVSTSVSVPDSGGAFLGGVGRSSMGSQEFAPPWMRPPLAGGISTSASGVGVRATIHDLTGPTIGAADAAPSADQQFRDRLTSASRDQLPRAALTRQADDARNAREAQRFLVQGDRARDAGKYDVAKVYYGMSARRAEGELARVVADRLLALAHAAQTAGKN